MAKLLINTSSLARLADSNMDDQLASLGVASLTGELQAAMAELSAKRRKDDVEAAAAEVLNLNANANEVLTANVTSIAALNDQIAAFNIVNAAIVRARQYGAASDNWLPLAASIGITAPAGTKDALKKVPADFTVTPVAAVAAA